MIFAAIPYISYLPVVLLTIALVVALSLAYRVWAEINEEDEPVSDAEVLREIERAHYAGEIDASEMKRVRELLGQTPTPRTVPPRPAQPRTQESALGERSDGASENPDGTETEGEITSLSHEADPEPDQLAEG